VVIEPDRVKIEKEKEQEVVDWPVLREVKNIQRLLKLAKLLKIVC